MKRLCSPSIVLAGSIILFTGLGSLCTPRLKAPSRQPCDAYLTQKEWDKFWSEPHTSLPFPSETQRERLKKVLDDFSKKR
jgi:hypothetical protein